MAVRATDAQLVSATYMFDSLFICVDMASSPHYSHDMATATDLASLSDSDLVIALAPMDDEWSCYVLKREEVAAAVADAITEAHPHLTVKIYKDAALYISETRNRQVDLGYIVIDSATLAVRSNKLAAKVSDIHGIAVRTIESEARACLTYL